MGLYKLRKPGAASAPVSLPPPGRSAPADFDPTDDEDDAPVLQPPPPEEPEVLPPRLARPANLRTVEDVQATMEEMLDVWAQRGMSTAEMEKMAKFVKVAGDLAVGLKKIDLATKVLAGKGLPGGAGGVGGAYAGTGKKQIAGPFGVFGHPIPTEAGGLTPTRLRVESEESDE